MPASSANLGPGLRLHGGGALAEAGAGGDRDRAVRGGVRAADRARAARTCACARSSACTRPTRFTFRIRSEIPLSGGLGSSAAAIVAGLMAADHLFELDVDLLAHAQRARGASGQRRRVAARWLRDLRRRSGHALRAADGPRGAGGRARGGGAHAAPRARRWPSRCRSTDAVFNVAHARAADARPGARRLGPARRAACRTACTSSGARSCSRARIELALRARELGALGATISGAGPTVLVWCFYEQTGAVAEALRGRDRRLGDAAARAVRAAGRLRRRALAGFAGDAPRRCASAAGQALAGSAGRAVEPALRRPASR